MLKNRCPWCVKDPLYIEYHDKEWGVIVQDDKTLFEFLILEGMQAGLSWLTILKKRENFRAAFDDFNPTKIVKYSDKKIASLMNNTGIIRNRLKINATIENARAYLNLREQQTLHDFLWQFTEGKPILNHWKKMSDVPSRTPISDQLSKALKKQGFKFVGTTICYSLMQAVGIVNDHLVDCFRYKECT